MKVLLGFILGVAVSAVVVFFTLWTVIRGASL